MPLHQTPRESPSSPHIEYLVLMCLLSTTIPRGGFIYYHFPSCSQSNLSSTPDNGLSFRLPFCASGHLESSLRSSRPDIGKSHSEIWRQKAAQRWRSQVECRRRSRRLDALINNWRCTSCCECVSICKALVAWRWLLCHLYSSHSRISLKLPYEVPRCSHSQENSSCPNLQVVSSSRIAQLSPPSSASGSFWR